MEWLFIQKRVLFWRPLLNLHARIQIGFFGFVAVGACIWKHFHFNFVDLAAKHVQKKAKKILTIIYSSTKFGGCGCLFGQFAYLQSVVCGCSNNQQQQEAVFSFWQRGDDCDCSSGSEHGAAWPFSQKMGAIFQKRKRLFTGVHQKRTGRANADANLSIAIALASESFECICISYDVEIQCGLPQNAVTRRLCCVVLASCRSAVWVSQLH